MTIIFAATTKFQANYFISYFPNTPQYYSHITIITIMFTIIIVFSLDYKSVSPRDY